VPVYCEIKRLARLSNWRAIATQRRNTARSLTQTTASQGRHALRHSWPSAPESRSGPPRRRSATVAGSIWTTSGASIPAALWQMRSWRRWSHYAMHQYIQSAPQFDIDSSKLSYRWSEHICILVALAAWRLHRKSGAVARL